MADRGPYVSQVSAYVDESCFLKRIGRRTIRYSATVSRPALT